ncbi:hypothetical protein MNBD_BACTEROID01-1717 [hydrothermal vent metagenome]|uniref:Transcriptional regulator, Crp/Fnr family n=1 Tax=hydrothermal vent metagenome TaxID=652676 RepID=A0A3B0UVA2_9ZZZZ
MGVLLEKDCEICVNNCCAVCVEEHQSSVFSILPKEDLDILMENKQEISFKPGETILKQNTSSTHVVCIKKGIAKVYIEGVKGRCLILKLISDLDFITGGGIFANHTRHFTVTAITDVECCLINSEQILKLFSKNSEFALEILKHHNYQNNQYLSSLINLTQKYMPGRVADSILYLKNKIFKTNSFQIPLTRQELSDMSAMTKESYVRILKEFKNSGIIKPNGNSMEILDEDALISISRNG